MAFFKPTPIDAELERLLEEARKIEITPEMYAAQCKSWVKGNMMLDNPEMTEAEFERIWASPRLTAKLAKIAHPLSIAKGMK